MLKSLVFESVTKMDSDHVKCIALTDKGTRKIIRMFRKHTKEIRNLKEQGIYCFEIQGILYWYTFGPDGYGIEYKAPEDFRAAERKGKTIVTSKERNAVSIEIPRMPPKAPMRPIEPVKEDEPKEVRHKQYEAIKTCIENDIPVYLTGPAGAGKNYTLEQISWDLGLEFYFTNSVQQEYKLTGFIDAGGKYHETEFYKAFKNGGIFFLDEMDASIPEVLVLLNAAIANKYFEFPNGKITAHENFRVVAAGNTVGSGADEMYTGRLVLDMATLDRFVIIDFDYDENIELHLAKGNRELVNFIRTLREEAKTNGIRATFSYRCITMVTKLEAAGMDLKQILIIAVFKGMGKDDINCFGSHLNNKYSKALENIQGAA